MNNLQLTTYNKILLKLFVLLFLAIPFFVTASSADIVVDAGNNLINALEATVKFPASMKITGVQDGDSAILIWITKPNLDSKTHSVSLSGITPGGFQGKKTLFSFTGEFNPADLSKILFSEVRALKNDGEGTAVKVKLEAKIAEAKEDTNSPEPFKPIISSSPDIFEGRYFISFLTQDKGVGIDRYEYADTWLFGPSKNDWGITDSPMVLTKLQTFKKIFVKAVDRAGNERIEAVSGPYRSYVLVVGLLIITVLLFVWRRMK